MRIVRCGEMEWIADMSRAAVGFSRRDGVTVDKGATKWPQLALQLSTAEDEFQQSLF